ncbi:MAG: hypothetical protein K2L82_06070 [Lachnospiraceae bacterium]|nr:hypothetical protein [Lachnospiraceae bacterium]
MEQEKIIYFYPITKHDGQPKCICAAKRYWFQDASLKTGLFDDGDLQVVGCAIPPFYYRCRAWKPQSLSEAMENVLRRVEGMTDALTDTWLHPQVAAMLTTEYDRRWAPREDTVRTLTRRLLDRYAGDIIRQGGEVSVLLGEPADTDRQMEMTRELLHPYLPRINRLLIFYEEIAETDIWMELGSHLDEYYYEYGLVPQLEPYQSSHAGVQECRETDNLRCGKIKCGGLILDYCAQFRYPRILPESDAIYLDVASVAEKERQLRRKTPRIQYISPSKYLDTMVKNSYDS